MSDQSDAPTGSRVSDTTLLDIALAKLRAEMFAALQHPNDHVRRSAYELLRDLVLAFGS